MRFALALLFLACGCGASSASPTPAPSDAAGSDATPDHADDRDASVDAARDAGPTLHVLFIGNSYTYVNDLPGRLHLLALAQADGPAIETTSVTAGATTLQNHWNDPNVKNAIAAGGNDFVVLQGQSVEPALAPTSFQTYAGLLAGAVKAGNAKPVFYETWARKAGSDVYLESWSGGSPDALQDILLAQYAKAATDASAKLAPVGEAFRTIVKTAPQIELYDPDGSHPSAAGTYLAACVFYDALTGQTFAATGAVPDGIGAGDAKLLRDAAAQAVAAHP
jgi:hypothetical protein